LSAGDDKPALGVLELSLIARGMIVTDAALKKSPVSIVASRPVSGGFYLVILRGDVAEIEEAMDAARERAGDGLRDWLLLPYADPQLWPLMPEPVRASGWEQEPDAEAVAVVETQTMCATLGAADAAAKTAEVVLRDMQLAANIGGKAFFSMTGILHDVEAAADAARAHAGARLLSLEIIASPVDELRGRLIW
jgi:microcompartment protein CcmL/EutN